MNEDVTHKRAGEYGRAVQILEGIRARSGRDFDILTLEEWLDDKYDHEMRLLDEREED